MNRSLTILVIEDNEPDFFLIQESFTATIPGRFLLLEASRIDEALDLLATTHVDLVLLDLGLPDSEGLSSLYQIRSAISPGMPLLVLTGHDDEKTGLLAIQAGAEDYLVKGREAITLLPRICLYTVERVRAQLEAQSSRQFLLAAIDSLPARIAILDSRGMVLLANRSWRTFAESGSQGRSIGEGANFFTNCEYVMGEPGNAKRFLAGVEDVLQGQSQHFSMEYRRQEKDEKQWFICSAYPFLDGNQGKVVVSHEDITPLKEAEQALVERDRFVRMVLDASPNLIAVKDKNGRYIMVNQALARNYGAKQKEILGRNDVELRQELGLRVEEAIQIVSSDRQVLEENRTLVIKEEPLVDRKGVTNWFNTVKTPIVSKDDGLLLLCVSSNITELREKKEDLKNTELRLRTVLNALDLDILLLDLDFRIVWGNEQIRRSAGVELAAMVGKHCASLFDRQYLCEQCTAKKAIETVSVHTTQVKTEDGKTIQLTGCPVVDSKGVVTGVVSVAGDITEKVALEQQLRQSQKLESLGTLAGGIAHDFNNILTAILGYAGLCLDQVEVDSQLAEDLQQIRTSGLRAKDLVKQILTFSRRIEKKRGQLDLASHIKETLKLLRSSLPATIEMRGNLVSGLGMVLADPIEVHQLVMNLCVNAAHAMQEKGGGVLEVSLTKTELTQADTIGHQAMEAGKYFQLEVKDTGTGIPQTMLANIFDPYFTTKMVGEGTGLGLSVVHGIVRECGGTIKVDSTFGKGTVFTVLLPMIESEENSFPATESSLQELYSSKGERLLVIDDEPTIARLCARVLRQAGYHVEYETDSAKAFLTLRNSPDAYDLVISDVTMPQMTGDRLAEEIKKISGRLPFLLMSGNLKNIPESIAQTANVALIAKPLHQAKILQKVRMLLNKQYGEQQV